MTISLWDYPIIQSEALQAEPYCVRNFLRHRDIFRRNNNNLTMISHCARIALV